MAETAEHRFVGENGYVRVRDCFGILGNPGAIVLEHRLIATLVVGRRLEEWEQVHHIDHNPSNNSPDNLLVVSPSEHAQFHKGKRKKKNKTKNETKNKTKRTVSPVHFNGNSKWVKLRCPECGKKFFKSRAHSYFSHPNKMGNCNFCSNRCSTIFKSRVEERGYITAEEQQAIDSCYICSFTTNLKFMREFLNGKHPGWRIDDCGEFHE